MNKIFGFLCLLVVNGSGSAFPRARSSYYYPRSYMVGGSFYANPRHVRQGPGYEYLPPGQMTAMVVGDTVATNSFSGPPNDPNSVLPVPNLEVGQVETDQEQITEKQQPFVVSVAEPDSVNETEPEEIAGEQENLFSIEDAITEAAVVATTKVVAVVPSKAPSASRKPKAGKGNKRPAAPTTPAVPSAEEEDDSDLPATWPFAGAGRGIPAYNAFFPIFIGGRVPSSRSSSRATGAQEEAGYPGSATAIANSFSTGKGGIATSHATSFGDPYAAAMLRNANLFNYGAKGGNRKQPVREVDEE